MPFESMPAALIAWIVFVSLLGGFIQGALGFGFPFVATPLIAMATDMRTAIVTVLVPTLATIVVTLATSGSLRGTLARFWMMPLYSVIGATIGTTLFVAAPGFPYTLLLALITLVYLNLDRMGLEESARVKRHERRFGVAAGLAAGLFEGTANVAGPPLIIFYLLLGVTPVTFVQALNMSFFIGKSTQLVVMSTYGGVSFAHWLATVPLAVLSVGAAYTGVRVRNRVDAVTYRVWVKRALLVISLTLIAQYAYSKL